MKKKQHLFLDAIQNIERMLTSLESISLIEDALLIEAKNEKRILFLLRFYH